MPFPRSFRAALVGVVLLLSVFPAAEVAGAQEVSGVLLSRATGSALDLDDAGRLVQNEADGRATQRWRLRVRTDGAVALINDATGQCVAAPGPNAGLQLVTASCALRADQAWQLLSTSDGAIKFVSAATSMAIDLPRGAVEDGTTVIQWPRYRGASQNWALYTRAPSASTSTTTSASPSTSSTVPATSDNSSTPAAPWDVVTLTQWSHHDASNYWSRILGEPVEPGLSIFVRSIPTACGQGAGAGFYCRRDDTVYLNRDFSERVLHGIGDFAVAWVVAHEIAHHIQDIRNLRGSHVGLELQADCLAGAWGADLDARGLLEEGDLDEAVRLASQIGDPGHGSGQQRAAAVVFGFENGVSACVTEYR